jgi:CubicO group peptidase (beta-lactamase class C family)
MRLKYLCLCLIFLTAPAFAAEDSSSDSVSVYTRERYSGIAERFDSLFHNLSSKRRFNGNVLVSTDGNIVYEKSFGYSDYRRRKPLSLRSVFELASVTKQFTAMGVMILYDEGKLDFDDPVTKYIPNFPYQKITIRHLLCHRSGLPDYLAFAWKYRRGNGYLTNEGLVGMLVDNAPGLIFEPGNDYRYSNTGYAVLARVIEKISGVSYDRFMTERIFAPLGMTSTYVFTLKKGNWSTDLALGYNKRGRPVYGGYLDGVVGDKGIYTTIEDMFKWDQGLYDEGLVRDETLAEAFTPSSHDAGAESDYGYGWRIVTLDNGEKIVFHTGWWGGYNSLFLRRLSDRSAIVVLSNRVNWSFCNIPYLLEMIGQPANRDGKTAIKKG